MKSFEKISKMNLADLGETEEPLDTGMEENNVTEVFEPEVPQEEQPEAILEEEPQMAVISEDAAEEEEVEVEGEVKKMMDPTGEHYYIDAKITEKEFLAFLFSHNFRQPLMIAAYLIAIIWPVMAFVRGDSNAIFAVAMAAVVILFIPFSTWTRGKKAINSNPLYQEIFHFMIDEWGVHLELGTEAVDIEWKRIQKCVFLKSVTVLYTNKINAHLIPTSGMGARTEQINQFIKRMKNR